MKNCTLVAPRQFALIDSPMPVIECGTDVLVRVLRVGVCGSDVHYFTEGRIGSQVVEYPWTVGHEGAGIVAAVGDAVAGLRVGDRVAFDPALPCWGCEQCLAGRPHTCNNLRFLGCPGQIEGCLAEYMVFPERNCLSIPDSILLEKAAMIEPLSVALYGAKLFDGLAGASAGVFGCGPIGLCLLQAAKALGVGRIYATDPIAARLAIARSLGADWVGVPTAENIHRELGALDVVFECCGQQDALDLAVEVLKPGGTLMLVGIPEVNRVSFDISLLRRKELRIQNVRRQNDCMRAALGMIESGAVNVGAMITHRFPLTQTAQAFELVAAYGDGVVKATINLE